MSPLSTPKQQEDFIRDVAKFQRRALWAIAASYLLLFAFVIASGAFYFSNQDNLQEASCTGRLTVRNLLIFADHRIALISKPPPGAPPPTAAQKAQTKAAHEFYQDALANIDVSDCAGVTLKQPLNPRGGST